MTGGLCNIAYLLDKHTLLVNSANVCFSIIHSCVFFGQNKLDFYILQFLGVGLGQGG
jgi:hypothetical protein